MADAKLYASIVSTILIISGVSYVMLDGNNIAIESDWNVYDVMKDNVSYKVICINGTRNISTEFTYIKQFMYPNYKEVWVESNKSYISVVDSYSLKNLSTVGYTDYEYVVSCKPIGKVIVDGKIEDISEDLCGESCLKY